MILNLLEIKLKNMLKKMYMMNVYYFKNNLLKYAAIVGDVSSFKTLIETSNYVADEDILHL